MLEITAPTALAIAGGGAIGATCRAALDSFLSARFNWRSPWPIVTINVLGSFVLGLVVGAGLPPLAAAGLGIGLCGAFTTMSTAMLDAVKLLLTDFPELPHRIWRVALMLIFTVIMAVLAASAGMAITSG